MRSEIYLRQLCNKAFDNDHGVYLTQKVHAVIFKLIPVIYHKYYTVILRYIKEITVSRKYKIRIAYKSFKSIRFYRSILAKLIRGF